MWHVGDDTGAPALMRELPPWGVNSGGCTPVNNATTPYLEWSPMLLSLPMGRVDVPPSKERRRGSAFSRPLHRCILLSSTL